MTSKGNMRLINKVRQHLSSFFSISSWTILLVSVAYIYIKTTNPFKAFLSKTQGKIPNNWPCNIPRLSAVSEEEFYLYYATKEAVILQNLGHNNTKFMELTTKERLMQDYGDVWVTLSSADTYSHLKKEMELRDYIREYVTNPVAVDQRANETWYLFGDHGKELDHLLQNYQLPPFSLNPRVSFGVGGENSGVPFHFHGPGFSEVIHGAKHWLIYPGGERPPASIFRPQSSALQWLFEVYPTLQSYEKPLECTIYPGEVLYFPSGWYHATFNIGAYTVFASTFTDSELELRRSEGSQIRSLKHF